jgi:DUF971 family protein
MNSSRDEKRMSAPRPQEITLDRTRRVLVVRWQDGHLSEYGWRGLRASCPCAECAGGDENMGRPPDPREFFQPDQPGPRNTLNEVGLVGNYALTLTWGDGHHAGIFNWAFLRGLCPCPQCFPAQSAA